MSEQTLNELIKIKIQSVVPISEEELNEFLDEAQAFSVQKNHYFTKPNRVVDSFYFLASGLARHYIKPNQSKEITKNFITEKSFFLPSFSDATLTTSSKLYCKANESCKGLVWRYSDLILRAERNPLWYKFFYRLSTIAFIKKEKKEIEYYTLDAMQRYKKFTEDFDDLHMRIPNIQLASYLNITPETLSRLKKKALFD